MKETLTTYLKKYYDIQEKILLVYREKTDSPWTDRCFYLDEKYNSSKPYNHRSILYCEVVFEYDLDDKKKNKELVDKIAKRLTDDSISWSKWESGNKSIHLHAFFDYKEVANLELLKRTIIKHYTEGQDLPDMRLTTENHLIRAEFGIHEATGKKKTLLSSYGKDLLSRLPQKVWDKYIQWLKHGMNISIVKRTDNDKITDSPEFKFLLNPRGLQLVEDGRERTLFMLIHLLKKNYQEDKKGLIKFLQDWYKYAGGFKISPREIENKVNYHWKKEYNITMKYVNNLIDEIGARKVLEGDVKCMNKDVKQLGETKTVLPQ